MYGNKDCANKEPPSQKVLSWHLLAFSLIENTGPAKSDV